MGSGRMRARKGRGPIARVPNGSAFEARTCVETGVSTTTYISSKAASF